MRQAERGEAGKANGNKKYIWHITVGKKPADRLLWPSWSWLLPAAWSQRTLIQQSRIAKTKAEYIFLLAFLLDWHLHVKAYIYKKRELSNSEREREFFVVPHYHQFNLCQSHRLCWLETYNPVSAGTASKKPAGSAWRELSISLQFWLKFHGLEVGEYSYIF